MPSDWQYHGDGVQTGLSTTHDLDGSLKQVTLQLDSFKHRQWTEEEVDDHSTKRPEHLQWDDQKEVFEEHADGAHATVVFDMVNGQAVLDSIEPEDGEAVRVEHMPILRAAERVVKQLTEVEEVWDPMDTLTDAYDKAADIHIERLDG